CPGLEVSLSQLLERCLLQLRFGEQPLERRVLLLELLQALRVVGLEPAVLVPPSVVRLLGHSELPAHRRDIPPVGEHPVGLAELADDLFRGVTLPAVRHDLTSLPAHNRGRQDDSQNHRTYETGSAHRHHTMPTQIVRTSVVSASANRCKFSGTTTRVPSLRYRSRRISSITDSTR